MANKSLWLRHGRLLQENESKRNRAEKRAQEEKKQGDVKEKEITHLKVC